jgi:CHC2 zinc finger
MSIDTLLSRLTKVRRTGAGRWIACCPAHEDRSPSLSVRDCGDGRILLHCFGGCDVYEVVSAVGMELSDLFPPRPVDETKRPKQVGMHPADALTLMEFEARQAAIIISTLREAGCVPDCVSERLASASARITAARAACHAA